MPRSMREHTGTLYEAKKIAYDRCGKTRESAPSFGALAPGARDRPATAFAKAVAGYGHQPLNLWYRRRKQASQQAALAARQAAFARAEVFMRQLQAELARAAWCHQVMAAIFAAAYAGARLRKGLLDKSNTASNVWADTAYRSAANGHIIERAKEYPRGRVRHAASPRAAAGQPRGRARGESPARNRRRPNT
jgi:hypothetical protein